MNSITASSRLQPRSIVAQIVEIGSGQNVLKSFFVRQPEYFAVEMRLAMKTAPRIVALIIGQFRFAC